MDKLYEKYLDMWYDLRSRIEEISFLSSTINVNKLLDVMDDITHRHLSK